MFALALLPVPLSPRAGAWPHRSAAADLSESANDGLHGRTSRALSLQLSRSDNFDILSMELAT